MSSSGVVASKAKGGQAPYMTSPDSVAVLRIEIEGIEPLIWRRVSVRTSMSLRDVHSVIQAAMGWLDGHLWQFEADGRRYSLRIPDEPAWNEQLENATRTKLLALLSDGVRTFRYLYDMGDCWGHRIIVERIRTAELGASYPQFLGAERRCPPEDCGGVLGYYKFLKEIVSKDDKKRRAALAWYGGSYDPNNMDEQQITTALRGLASAWR
jgi:hypothetical protein